MKANASFVNKTKEKKEEHCDCHEHYCGCQYHDCGCGHHHKGDDKFRIVHPDTNWKAGVEYGEQIGLGNRSYELINVR